MTNDWEEQRKLQLSLLKQTREFANEICSGGTLSRGTKNYVCLALILKALETSLSIELLQENLRMGDSIALTRVLFENAINLAFIVGGDESVATKYWSYPKVETWLLIQSLRQAESSTVRTFSNEAISRAESDYLSVKSMYPNPKHWSGQNLFKMAEQLDQTVGFNNFTHFVNNYWKIASSWVHSSASSIENFFSEANGRALITPPYTAEYSCRVLYGANMALLNVAASTDHLHGAGRFNEWKLLRDTLFEVNSSFRDSAT